MTILHLGADDIFSLNDVMDVEEKAFGAGDLPTSSSPTQFRLLVCPLLSGEVSKSVRLAQHLYIWISLVSNAS